MARVDGGLLLIVVIGPAVMVLIVVIARAAAAGRIRRNGFVGIRLPSTLAGDRAWAAGHRAAVRPGVRAAVVLACADVVAVLLASLGAPAVAMTIPLVVLLLAAVAVVAVRADQQPGARERRDGRGRALGRAASGAGLALHSQKCCGWH